MALLALALLVLSPLASSSPTRTLTSRQSEYSPITALTSAQIDTITPYAYYASVAYCPATVTIDWSCGSYCEANAGFVPVASGGNGDGVQYWYVGYDPNLDSAIVAHQGTNTSEILSLVTDANFFLTTLESSAFPDIGTDIQVDSGFLNAQSLTQGDILSAVKTTLSTYGTSKVSIVGHSLGAAIALLDSVYLPLNLPSGTEFVTYVFGLPRVGNQAFANYVDANLHLTHVNNEEDPIPICPGEFLGFVHPSGEVHIEDSGEWASCPGQDNPSTQCIVGDVPTIFQGDESDHDGPYNGVMMGSCY